MVEFIDNKKTRWHSADEITKSFNRSNIQINRLMLLDYAWKKIVNERARFWVLSAVQGSTLFVKVKISVAKNELVGRRREIIRELNKYFDKPWIKHIEIQ